MSYEEIYKKLREQYTVEEIAESMMIPAELTEEEEKKAEKELRKYRFQRLKEMTEEDWIHSDTFRLRFQMEDYLKEKEFSPEKTFGKYLEEYIHAIRKSKKAFSEDIGVHYTRLSRILHGKEEPNLALMYRLEKHSGELIPAILWWKLTIKKQEHQIRKDKETRIAEGKKVKNALESRKPDVPDSSGA